MGVAISASELEQRTQTIGRELLDRLRAARPRFWQPAWWHERMLRQFMADEWLKVQAFRFVDALPALRRSADVAGHLREYFGRATGFSPGNTRSGHQTRASVAHRQAATKSASHKEWLHDDPASANTASAPRGSLVTPLLQRWTDWESDIGPRARLTAWAARRAAFGMSGSFIAGSNIDEAEAAIRRMRKQRLAFTIDLLGEAALSPQEAEHYHKLYLRLLDDLPDRAADWPDEPQIDRAADGSAVPRVNVSVKITAIYPGFDPIVPKQAKARAKELLRPMLRKAMTRGSHLHVDMEHHAIKDLTLDLVCELFSEPEFRDYPHLGVVLQAYLVDADRDVQRMIDFAHQRGTPFWIRLVKGAYWDSESIAAQREHWPCPVWTQKWQSDACYERCAARLVENHRHIRTAFASHNVRSLAHAIALRDLHEAPGSAFELQMLFGMGDPIKAALAERGERCRVYTPYGDVLPGMAYLIRRLLENTANESFLRQGSEDDVPAEELLRNPEQTGLLQTERAKQPDFACFSIDDIQKGSFLNIADTNFALPQNQNRMHEALRGVRARADEEHALLLDGQSVVTGQWIESRNPAQPHEVVGRVALADRRTAENAITAAKQAFGGWRATSNVHRAELLFEAAARLEARRFEFAAGLVLEIGKPWREADAEVSEAVDYLNYYAHQIRELDSALRLPDVAGEANSTVYEPRGVTAAIGPWNFPLAIFANLIAAPLAAGNTVVAKPASAAVVIATKFIELLHEAGAPPGVVNGLAGPGAELGPVLVAHPDVEIIAFAGTRDVGLDIHRRAAAQLSSRPALKKTVLALGGKNAIIIDDDADLDEAISGVRAGAFGFAGQKCTSVSRVIVLQGVYERFVERLDAAVDALSSGPAEQPGTSIPPLIDAESLSRVRNWIEIGKREGRCILEGGIAPELKDSGGYYCGAVILTDVSPTARIAQEEIAGPILCVLKARDFEQAIEIFNGVDYALVGGLYSRSPAHIQTARQACLCGNFYINRRITGSKVGRQPFGGLKLSGDGARIGGPDYLREFCEPRTITENTLRRGFAPNEDVKVTAN